jgi:hypothetical protein
MEHEKIELHLDFFNRQDEFEIWYLIFFEGMSLIISNNVTTRGMDQSKN